LNRPREARPDEASVDTDVGRQSPSKFLAAAGYAVAVGLIVWGIISSDSLPILLGLVGLAILVLTTDG
jgi:hypothetical protein